MQNIFSDRFRQLGMNFYNALISFPRRLWELTSEAILRYKYQMLPFLLPKKVSFLKMKEKNEKHSNKF